MSEHKTFWKPEKQVKEKKAYNSLSQRKSKAKKEVPEWKKGLLAHHQPGQSSKDRCDFDKDVLAEIIAEQDEACPCCKVAPANTTHHVWPRGRKGRGVKTNALRVCWPCHDKIQTNDELLQYWISVYRENTEITSGLTNKIGKNTIEKWLFSRKKNVKEKKNRIK